MSEKSTGPRIVRPCNLVMRQRKNPRKNAKLRQELCRSFEGLEFIFRLFLNGSFSRKRESWKRKPPNCFRRKLGKNNLGRSGEEHSLNSSGQ